MFKVVLFYLFTCISFTDSTLSLDETTDEILDEDAVLGVSREPLYIYLNRNSIRNWDVFFFFFVQDEEIEELSSKPDSQELVEKRKLSTDSNSGNSKKIVINRNPILEDIQSDLTEKENNNKSDSSEPEKKVIKLSQLGVKEVMIIIDQYLSWEIN